MIQKDPLFKGCTRPAMVFGVPIVPLGIVVGTVILLTVWINMLVALSLIPLVFTMRMITKSDDQQFRLLGLKLWCRVLPHANRNALFWNASTYSPLILKKRKT